MDIEEYKKNYFAALKPVAEDLRKIGLEIKTEDFTHLKAKNGIVLPLQDIGIKQEKDDLHYLKNKYGLLQNDAV